MLKIKNKYADNFKHNWNQIVSKFNLSEKLIEQGTELSNAEAKELKDLYVICNMNEAHIIQTHYPLTVSNLK